MTAFESDTPLVKTATDNGVLTITLARDARRNALTSTMYRAMTRALVHAARDASIRVVKLAAEGSMFCAGNDIDDFLAADAGTDITHGPALTFIRALAGLDKPVVAGVQGLATGIGTTLLLHVDFVIAGDSARFYTAFADLGLVPEAGASRLLAARVGEQNAARLLLAGETLNAGQARAMGLIAEHVTDDALTARCEECAARLAAKPPAALQASKRLLRAGREIDLDALLEREANAFRQRLLSVETRAIISQKLG